jgi:anti-sigma B factor antagonist
MPDDEDFTINDPQHVLDGTNAAGEDEIPSGDSGVLVAQPTDPNLLKITKDGTTLTIGFNRVDVPDEVCIAGYRQQVFDLLENNPDCKVLTFDVTGIHLLPSGMLGLLASLKKRVGNIEVLNPARDVREALRVTRLNTLFTIRET